MSPTPMATNTHVELLLRKHVKNLPVEYQDGFKFAIYNQKDSRLVGNIWSLKWDGERAYLI